MVDNKEEIKDQLKVYTPKEFEQAYKELCEKMGYQLSIVPIYKARDDGTFSTLLQAGIAKLPQQV